MFKNKPAVSISTADINGNGVKDLTVNLDDEKLFTIYDLKNLLLKILGTAAGGFLAIFGYFSLM